MNLVPRIRVGLRILITLWILAGLAGAGQVSANLLAAPGEPPRLADDVLVVGDGTAPAEMVVERSSFTSIDLAARSGEFQVQKISLKELDYLAVAAEGLGKGTQIGLPDLPVLRRDVEIPFGARYSLELISSQYTEVSLADLGLPEQILPLQPAQPKCGEPAAPCQPDSVVYQQDAFFPASPLALGGEYEVRGHRALTVEAWPVAYNPVQGRLRVYSELRFRIRLEGANAIQTLAESARLASPAFEASLAGSLLNYNLGQGARTDAQMKSENYLIITADAYYSGLADFIALKQSQGFNVSVAKTGDIGSTATAIKDYIVTQYNGLNPPSYVLFVGDTDTIPNWAFKTSGQTSYKTDLYYVTMGGTSDYVPDIYRGRFPVRDAAQLANMVNNNLWYENDVTGSEAWVKKAAFLATDDSGYYGLAEGTHNYVISTYTLPLGYTGTFPGNPQAGGDKLYAITYSAKTTHVINSLNDGRVMAVYSGHGNQISWAGPTVSQTNVRSLSGNLIPYVAGHACLTADFNTNEAFSDTWVIQNGKGGLVYLGASNNSYWNEDDKLERVIFDTLYDTAPGDPSVAQAMHAGLAAVQTTYPSYAQYYWEEYNLFGDPSLVIVRGPREEDFSLAAQPNRVGICGVGQASSTLTVGSLLGYATPVTLSLGGAPAGISPDFVPTSVTPPGTSTLTLSSDGTAGVGSYALTVIGTSGARVHTAPLDLDIYNALPGAPVLLSPVNGALQQVVKPTLTWQAAAQGGSYTLQVATDAVFTDLVVDIAGLSTTSYTLETALDSGRRYYWRVSAQNACGAGESSAVFSFNTAPLPGDCSEGDIPQVLHFSDLESGWNGWTDASMGSDHWALSTEQAYSLATALKGVDVARVSDQRLVSPALTLPAVIQQPITFAFWQRHSFEGTASPTACWDGGVLEVSTDDGANWTQLTPMAGTYGYNGTVPASYSNPLAGKAAWCGDTREWERTVADLGAYAGQTVRLRLRLGTDNSVGDIGWYVDDLRVQSCLRPNQAPTAEDLQVSTLMNTAKELVLQAEDAESDPLSWQIVDPPAHGGLSGTAPDLTYTPGTDFWGSDSFTFKVNDGEFDSNVAVVSITVLAVNDLPLASAQSLSTPEDLPAPVTLQAEDVYPGTLTWQVVTLPAFGSLSGEAPNLTYTPWLNYHGEDSFTFRVNDGEYDSAPATVSITVTPVNDAPLPPSIADVDWLARQAHTYAIPPFTDVDGDVLSYTATVSGQALPAWLAVDPVSGEFSGLPGNLEIGDYSLWVTASDGQGGQSSAAFVLSVRLNPYILHFPIILLRYLPAED